MSRKAQRINDLDRRRPVRKPIERVLIVCEGSKTEPNYFREVVDHLRLNSAKVEIDGNSASSPRSIFEHAIKRFQKDKEIDRIYCVFDQDTHSTYAETLIRIKESKAAPLYAITSVPCFEFWLLIHFTFTTKPYAQSGARSAAECVEDDLQRHLPHYKKGKRGIFLDLKEKLEIAINHSKQVQKHAAENDTDNPSTQIHELIEYLFQLKQA